MERIGIFGGSFNPVHWGHFLVAETALKTQELDQVIWVPTYRPAHKPTDPSSFRHRLAMVRLAIAQNAQFRIANVTVQPEQPSFAIATLNDLQRSYPNQQWFWILGIDAFQTLPKWPHHQRLMAQCTWLIAPRTRPRALCCRDAIATCQAITANDPARICQWYLLDMPNLDLSSSQIRQQNSQGQSIQAQVPPAIHQYIKAHGLYSQLDLS
jgi:nicotinate-nucleotide adenylyltransferase